MGKTVVWVAAFLVGWCVPVSALAAPQEAPSARPATPEDAQAVPDVEDDWEDDVSGHLAPTPRGRVEQARIEAAAFDPTFDEYGWGIRENKLHVVPRGTPQPDIEKLARLPGPSTSPWPSEHLKHAFNFANAYSFPQLYPTVSASLNAWGGSGGRNNPSVFASGGVMDLYLVRLGLNFLQSVPGTPWVERLDLDGRIPLALGDNVQLALLPGVSYDLNVQGTASGTNVRFQGILGYGGPGGFSAQVLFGATRGARPAGILSPLVRLSETQGILGGLLAFRIADVVQLRAEARSEFGKGADLLDILPGVAFYPWHDERLEVGVTAIIEDREAGLKFDNTTAGGLLHMGMAFY